MKYIFYIYPEIEGNSLTATATESDNGYTIKLNFKTSKGNYYSFLNDAHIAFTEQFSDELSLPPDTCII
jgi:hypothetical protein